MTADTEGGNVYQRLVRIAAEVGKVEATGKTQHGSEAMSVEDIEGAIREHLANERLITRWSSTELVDIGNGKLWLTRFTVRVVNADNPEDYFEDQWADIGSTPSAAASFAVKGYYRRLFHLGKADEEHQPSRGDTAPREQHNASRASAASRPAPRPQTAATPTNAAPAKAQNRPQGHAGMVAVNRNLINELSRISKVPVADVEPALIARAGARMGANLTGAELTDLAEDALEAVYDETVKALEKLTAGSPA